VKKTEMNDLTCGGHERGFTLLEMMVAIAVFLVVGGAALALYSYQQPVFIRQQNLSAVNIAVRNAVSQLQLEVVNAGNGYYTGANVPDWPIGVTIANSVPTVACNTPATYTYSAACFDQLNIIATDPNTQPSHPDNGTFSGLTTDCVSTTSSPMTLLLPGNTTVAAATAYASNFPSGSELLLVNNANSSITTVKLTSAGTVYTSGATSGVRFAFAVTNADGTNSAANDVLRISTNAAISSTSSTPKLQTQFCSGDWALKLDPVVFAVDTSTASDPELIRCQGVSLINNCSVANGAAVLAEQVIGFKVGAAVWNCLPTVSGTDTSGYSYNVTNACNATPWGYASQFWLIRSVQISLIARTTPAIDPTYTYRNGFDGGPYQIESVSVVVNPRNMSMSNQ